MPTLRIQDVDEGLYRALAARARLRRRTLSEEARETLRHSLRPSNIERRRALLSEIANRSPVVWPPGVPDPVDLLRADRER